MSRSLAVALTGCGWRGLNSFQLPGTAGGGPGSYTIQAQLPDVVTIQENTRVRVDDVNVGNVTKIELQDWHALVTMRINGDVHLPANSTAKLGQTSLLGSMHIELAAPKDEPPVGQLKNGSVIPLARASMYPTTEQTLASVSILLNGGGIGQLQEINQALAKAFTGRENDMRSLLNQLDEFVAGTNAQTDDIIAAAENLNSLAGQFAAKDHVVDKALMTVPKALSILADERTKIADAARSTRQVQRDRGRHHPPEQGIAGEQPAQHRAGAAVARRRRAVAHQGIGRAGRLPLAGVDREELVPRRLRQPHAGRRFDVEPHRPRDLHRLTVGRQPHRTRAAVGTHHWHAAQPRHRWEPHHPSVPLRGY